MVLPHSCATILQWPNAGFLDGRLFMVLERVLALCISKTKNFIILLFSEQFSSGFSGFGFVSAQYIRFFNMI